MTRPRIGEPSDLRTAPYTHLLPVLEAEESWGNKRTTRGFHQEPDAWWRAYMRDPLHIALLQDTFEFPDDIVFIDRDDVTAVHDPRHWCEIQAEGRAPRRRRHQNTPFERFVNRLLRLPEDA